MSQNVLQRPTLVLNRNWQPIHIATVARAVIMLYTGTVRVVDPKDYQTYNWEDWSRLGPHEEEHCIHSVSCQLRVPEVVVLAHYDGMPGTTVPFSRRNIYKRDRYTCQYCGRQPAIEDLTIDHVIPRAQGGVSSWENCVLACFECNKHKADHTLDQARMRLRYVPQRPTWRPLYSWHAKPIKSWARFLGEAYWNVTLQDE
jgi:5-methylcytosine-specific restriction endonuclease McrA